MSTSFRNPKIPAMLHAMRLAGYEFAVTKTGGQKEIIIFSKGEKARKGIYFFRDKKVGFTEVLESGTSFINKDEALSKSTWEEDHFGYVETPEQLVALLTQKAKGLKKRGPSFTKPVERVWLREKVCSCCGGPIAAEEVSEEYFNTMPGETSAYLEEFLQDEVSAKARAALWAGKLLTKVGFGTCRSCTSR